MRAVHFCWWPRLYQNPGHVVQLAWLWWIWWAETKTQAAPKPVEALWEDPDTRTSCPRCGAAPSVQCAESCLKFPRLLEPRRLRLCLQCGAQADHSPDDKACLDNCITHLRTPLPAARHPLQALVDKWQGVAATLDADDGGDTGEFWRRTTLQMCARELTDELAAVLRASGEETRTG